MIGLRIKTITGVEFEVHGTVEYSEGTYYCDGQSWPAEIVKGVLQ